MPFSLVPLLLLGLPIAEIAVFIVVGRHIGLLATLGLILLTAVIGSVLLRIQGFGLLARIRAEAREGRVPGRELVHGVMIMIAGILLVIPGFITDTLGFLLFIPALREAGWRLLKDRIVVVTPFGSASSAGPRETRGADGKPVIELGSDDFHRDPEPGSPWSSDRGGRREP